MHAPGCVAITGLRSFVGQRLAERLSARGHGLRVLGIDLRRPWRLERRVPFERVDLTDPSANARLAELFARERVEAVVHTAFRRDPTPDLEADHELETIGTLHLLHACAAAKVSRLVVASSTMLYGPRPDNPQYLSESHPLRGHPDAHCIRNRVEMEELVAEWGRKRPDADVTVLRCAWVMGPSHWDRVVRHFAGSLVTTVLGYDPLLQFVHEDDCLDAFEQAVLERRRGVYNVVAPGALPLSMLLRLAGKTALPAPAPLLYRIRDLASRTQTGDPPAAFYDYLRWLWLAEGERAWNAFGEPVYSTREAWISFVASRRMRQYR
ncbi:MAG: NAD-dependent epimerase/dehydratase family protein [Deltaproteobacteria bacterium]|nr:NAD-dependent epimerase/dehydratase family protein [Deltaproteobacteria bacterium]